MATHPYMLVAYDDAGNIISTLDSLVQRDEDGRPLGLVDFAAHEEAGGDMTDVWFVEQTLHDIATGAELERKPARGSKVWPEYLGSQAHEFRVELAGPAGGKHIAALVHNTSGVRRERSKVEAAIADRIAKAHGAPADIRDLVGGPDRPLLLDKNGDTKRQSVAKRPTLPLVTIATDAAPLASADQRTDTPAMEVDPVMTEPHRGR